MIVSVRSYLAAGLAAATVSAVAVVPVTQSGSNPITVPSIELSAAVLPLIQPVPAAAGAMLGVANPDSAHHSAKPAAAVAATVGPVPLAAATGSASDGIINAYNLIEPWVQWGFELGAWAVSYLPWPIGWLGQQINIAYDAGEPIVQALVYSFAFLIDGQFDLIGPTLANGVNTAVTNLVQGEIAWVLGFFPPLPPGPVFPIFPTAAVAERAAAAAATRADTAATAEATADTAATPQATADTAATPQATADTAAITEQQDAVMPGAIEAPLTRRAVNRNRIQIQRPAAVSVPHGDPAEAADAGPGVIETIAAIDAPATSPLTEPRATPRTAAGKSGSADRTARAARSAGRHD